MDWAAILDAWGDKLFLYAKQWAQADAEASDIVQEAFVRLWHQDTKCPIPSDEIASYCFTTVRRTALDHLRSSQRRSIREAKAGEWLYAVGSMFEHGTEKSEDQAAMEKALSRLPTEQREILTLKIWGGLTFKEISATVGISQNTAASRYRLALTSLRNFLSEGENQ